MYYVYILESQRTRELYIGFTTDLPNRIVSHNKGFVRSTRHVRLWRIIFYEAYRNKYDALRRERYLKTGKGWTTMKTMLREYFSTR